MTVITVSAASSSNTFIAISNSLCSSNCIGDVEFIVCDYKILRASYSDALSIIIFNLVVLH